MARKVERAAGASSRRRNHRGDEEGFPWGLPAKIGAISPGDSSAGVPDHAAS